MTTAVLLSSAYLPPVEYFSKVISYPQIEIELYEHFPKQTYRNRCSIYGANGKLDLIVPTVKYSERTLTKDIKISYANAWQKLHWKSMEAAYRSSPFFEYYEDYFVPFYKEKKFDFLIDLNSELFSLTNKLLQINPSVKNTSEYLRMPINTDDLRTLLSPKVKDRTLQPSLYSQVFENKLGFIPNLSIIDLLFNHGPSAREYIPLTINE